MSCIRQENTENYSIYNGDCVEVMKSLPSNSIDLSVYSPPFSDLFTYSDHIADMGNTANYDEFFKQYKYAICVLKKFLKEPDGWIENRLDSCLVLSYCYQASGNDQYALEILFHSFMSDIPRAEICCEIGKIFFMKQNFSMAAHWYHQALLAPDNSQNGGFYIPDCHNFIPFLQLCVCLDKSGMHKEAFEFHRKARTLKPEHPSVIQNQIYFHEILGF